MPILNLTETMYLLFESFMLIFIRMLGFFVVAPVIGGTNIPNMVRISISFFTAFLVLFGRNVILTAPVPNLYALGAMAITELFVGLILGFIVFIFFSIFYYVGQLIDYEIGFSMVSVFDPISQIQVPITGNLLYLLLSFLFILTGSHYDLFNAMFYTFDVIPLGKALFASDEAVKIFLSLVSVIFTTGFQVTLPITGALLVVQVALGLLTKTAPQMNIFSIGLPLKLMFGLVILYVIMPLFITISNTVFGEINTSLLKMIEVMIP